MRPRINTFGKISKSELQEYLTQNYVFGFIAKKNEHTILYTYKMMFRSNRNNPEELYIEVSNTSKLVLKAWTNKGIIFNSINELKKYTKK